MALISVSWRPDLHSGNYMADETKVGTHWQDDELDAIVVDYFAMLAAELSGQHYVKSRHNEALMAQIGRTHRSVEFKHQNISAVLDELGMPWIPGYKPKRNYQNAIFDAIDRYLTKHPAILEAVSAAPPTVTPLSAEIFVAPPVLTPSDGPIPEPLRRLVRKFDPVERDHRNRSLGKAGEEFVVDVERRKLTRANRPDLSSGRKLAQGPLCRFVDKSRVFRPKGVLGKAFDAQ
jgi:hypothetical protein